MKLTAAIKTSALLSLLFLVVYGGCNWVTSLRSDVGTLYFAWERYIPFVPVMIVPYMSIDLFFLAAPFLCQDERELRVFTKRVVFAIVVAGACFLLFPLRLAVERPHAVGWLGAIFGRFCSLDQPYNLVPSMHITLRTILAELYARHTRGSLRIASHVWFSLVGFSTVLTYQHHVMDVATGFMLAGYCFYVFRDTSTKCPVTVNRRIGFYYAAGALIVLSLTLALWPWGNLLLWPAMALGIMASAYLWNGPGIFRKRGGRLPLSTWWTLGPCLLGQYLSLLYYRRQCRAWNEVEPGVWIGRKLNDGGAAQAIRAGVTAVLDLTAEFSEARPFLAIRYLNIPVQDLTAPTQEQLRDMAAFIAEQSTKGVVYVHCKIGYSRSAAAVGAYLLTCGRSTTVAHALATLRQARPSIVIRPEVIAALTTFQQQLRSCAS